MLKRNKCFKAMVAALTVVLILAYAVLAFLPHTHACAQLDCAACVLVQILRATASALAVAASLCAFVPLLPVAVDARLAPLSARESSPVGLKVKLSN